MRQTHDTAAKALTEAKEALAALTATDQAEAAHTAIVTDADIATTRQTRDTLWQAHRAALDGETADAFATAMRQDDELRRDHATRADARLRSAQRRVALAEQAARVDRRREELADATAARDDVQAAAAELAARLGLKSADGALRDRRSTLLHAAQMRATAQRCDAVATQVEDRRAQALAAVGKTLAALGIDAAPDRVLPIAQRQKAELDKQIAATQARDKAAAGLAALARDRDAARTVADRTALALAKATAQLWCHTLEAPALLAILGDLNDLAALDQEAEDLDRRIARMTSALDSFRALAPELASALDLDPATDPTRILSVARQRATEAKTAAARISALQTIISEAQAVLATENAAITRCDASVDAVLAGQAADPDLSPQDRVARLTARDAVRKERRMLADERAALESGCDADDLAQEVARDDPLRGAVLTAATEDATAAVEDAIDRRGQARKALQQALARTGAAALDQDRATILETVREAARASAAQLLGLMAARGALRRFRQDRRGAMLQATEAAFATITQGEWPRLDTQPMGTTERLVGVRGDDKVAADQMSTGTRGQLYLALRIAGHADFVTRNGPLPFVTDDIHETFDDDRAQAAIALAGDMGRRGQVILFTHHRHLIDLARRAIPEVRVIEMASDT